MGFLWKFRVFALEMLLGLLIGSVGLLQLLFKVPLISIPGNTELMEKIAAALVTIGGTVLISGIFRFVFSVRLDEIERRILDSLRLGRHEIVAAISNFQPKSHSPRPQEQWTAYKHIFWRTKDDAGTAMWLRFSPLEWSTGILPFLDAYGQIDNERFGGKFRYYLTMVQLQSCLAISATRINSDGAPNGEMAGVYVFSIPVDPSTRLCGFLRHVNMGSRQSLSSCILSTGPIADADLDRLWLAGNGREKVDRNFSGGDEATTSQIAVA